MARQKVKVKILGNNEISKEEGNAIWAEFFDIFRKKEIKKRSSENKENKTVGFGGNH